ncbi:MurR/RpiR family transcriptional regulator [Liquorilactobacillus satsumensis]|uniref:MurR/RpiR family transcriptional regulator n=2 Tax=Liquorilactobacillus satsumensis TaxID=259059 RepID=UPI0021C4AE22|nr:MurR/RpiR family transcriptional regulator [Liquorilactobacillus satsumensis]MCP9312184.1 MurR/RpiR family transcriptional regulator [Liquorilactobacillus satsumensis]MCP9359462.1 MurR/RpiR family transcriptional regulator [Liquorilactobacillus satsumensis]
MVDLKNFTPTEILVYNYLISHSDEVMHLSIRQLAVTIHVSSASIMRCIKKMNYDSFYEFKFSLKQKKLALQDKELAGTFNTEIFDLGTEYFDRPLLQQYSHELNAFKKLVKDTNKILFFGIGTSGTLAQYGARQFSNFRINAFYNVDPFYPLPYDLDRDSNQIAILLSVSGETAEVIKEAVKLKEQKFHIVSITNNSYCTLARLSDVNFSYNVKPEVINETLNITTQIPVIFILESLARNIGKNPTKVEKLHQSRPH